MLILLGFYTFKLMSNVQDYIPIVLQSVVVLGFVVGTLVFAPKLGPKLSSKKKDANWECGIESDGLSAFSYCFGIIIV